MQFAFLHGGRHGGWCWKFTIDALKEKLGADQVQCLALDVPGCGEKRDRDCQDMGLDDILRELNDDVARAGIAPAILVGHSQAGLILPEMIAQAPALYSGVIFVSCALPLVGQALVDLMGTAPQGTNPDQVGFAADPTDWAGFVRVNFCEKDWPEDTVQWLVRETQQDDWPPRSMTDKIKRNSTSEFLPTAYITLTRDVPLPLAWQHRFAERAGAGDNIVEINAAHNVMISHPEALATELISFAKAWGV